MDWKNGTGFETNEPWPPMNLRPLETSPVPVLLDGLAHAVPDRDEEVHDGRRLLRGGAALGLAREPRLEAVGPAAERGGRGGLLEQEELLPGPVSYTHLTLPTKA